jgi:hypothetical protein
VNPIAYSDVFKYAPHCHDGRVQLLEVEQVPSDFIHLQGDERGDCTMEVELHETSVVQVSTKAGHQFHLKVGSTR